MLPIAARSAVQVMQQAMQAYEMQYLARVEELTKGAGLVNNLVDVSGQTLAWLTHIVAAAS